MSQMNFVSVDVSQSSDMQGSNGNVAKKSQAKTSAFSDAMEQHYPKQKIADLDKNNKQNGNVVPKTAIDPNDAHTLPVPLQPEDDSLSGKLTANDDVHTLPVLASPDDKALKLKLNTNDDAHTLPVPISPESDALKAKLIANDDEHTLPVPLSPESDASKVKLTANDDEHTLPVPLSPESDALKVKLTANDNEHTLPVPLSPESDALKVKLTANDDAHTLPVPLSPESDALKVKLTADDDAHTLPVPLSPESDALKVKLIANDDAHTLPVPLSPENEALKVKLTANDDAHTLPVILSPTSAKSQSSESQGVNTKDDIAGDLLKMLSGVDKLLTGANVEQVAQEQVLSEAENALAKAVTAEQVQLSSNTISEENAKQLKDVKNGEAQVANDKILAEASAAQQANTAELKRSNEPMPTKTVNQNTAAVASTPSTNVVVDDSVEVANDETLAKAANNSLEAEKLAKAEIEKPPLQAEKVASSFNQTLDERTAKPLASIADIAAQEAESIESVMNPASSNTAQIQKSITALNTETIAIYRKDFSDAVKDKVMVMINQKIQQVEIQLDPPEMGNIHVRVNLQNEQAAVQFVVQNQQAKEALEQNMGKLRDMLAENGVDVGEANIEQRQAQDQQGNDFNGQANGGQSGTSSEETSNKNDNPVGNMLKASSTGVDYYA
ncbi:MAG: flagellar hook-length control protein FliK [Cognaticolwellia sp.]